MWTRTRNRTWTKDQISALKLITRKEEGRTLDAARDSFLESYIRRRDEYLHVQISLLQRKDAYVLSLLVWLPVSQVSILLGPWFSDSGACMPAKKTDTHYRRRLLCRMFFAKKHSAKLLALGKESYLPSVFLALGEEASLPSVCFTLGKQFIQNIF